MGVEDLLVLVILDLILWNLKHILRILLGLVI